MVVAKYVPQRGDIVWITFDPTKGHEQSGRRPAIAVSPRAYNKISGRALFCPITTKVRGHIFEVLFRGKNVSGAILIDQIRSMDWRKRDVAFIEEAPLATMDDVEAKLLALIRSE